VLHGQTAVDHYHTKPCCILYRWNLLCVAAVLLTRVVLCRVPVLPLCLCYPPLMATYIERSRCKMHCQPTMSQCPKATTVPSTRKTVEEWAEDCPSIAVRSAHFATVAGILGNTVSRHGHVACADVQGMCVIHEPAASVLPWRNGGYLENYHTKPCLHPSELKPAVCCFCVQNMCVIHEPAAPVLSWHSGGYLEYYHTKSCCISYSWSLLCMLMCCSHVLCCAAVPLLPVCLCTVPIMPHTLNGAVTRRLGIPNY
jgi:hypothetical protein